MPGSELVGQLIETLREVPQTRAHLEQSNLPTGPRTVDAVVETEVAGQRMRLFVECKQQAFPRDVKQAAWQLEKYIADHPGSGSARQVPVIVAHAISPGAREILRQKGIGYFDSGGSLYLPAKGAFLFIDKPAPKSAERQAMAIFRGSRAQVLHAVWELREEWFGVNQIAHRAKVAPATASQTLTALERHGWVVSKGSGPAKERRLEDPRGLLDAWTDHQKKQPGPQLRRYYAPAGPVQVLMRHLDIACEERGVTYEVTGEAAGQEYAPYLSSVTQLRCRMIAGAPSEAALRALDARPVDEGWNLGVIDARGEGRFAFRRRGEMAWLASPLQVYLDLLRGGGRSREMAQHLREELLQ